MAVVSFTCLFVLKFTLINDKNKDILRLSMLALKPATWHVFASWKT